MWLIGFVIFFVEETNNGRSQEPNKSFLNSKSVDRYNGTKCEILDGPGRDERRAPLETATEEERRLIKRVLTPCKTIPCRDDDALAP